MNHKQSLNSLSRCPLLFWFSTLALLLTVPSRAQNLVWVTKAGGAGYDTAEDIVVDGAGYSLVTGLFAGEATFGAGEANETTLVASGNQHFFIARYNPDGTLSWAKQAAGNSHHSGTGIDVDDAGSITVTGSFQEAATFGAGEANETTLISNGATDLFVARYNPNGSLAWAQKAGGDGFDGGNSIATDNQGYSYVTGLFDEIAIFGEGDVNETVLTNHGYIDLFLARYNPDGTLAWATRAGYDCPMEPCGPTLSTVEGLSIAVDRSGNSFITGLFRDEVTFGIGETNETVLTTEIAFNLFVARYNPDGTLVWAKQAGPTTFYNGGVSGSSIAIDGSGNSYVTGGCNSPAVFGEGEANETHLTCHPSFDLIVARYDPEGLLTWVKHVGGPGNDRGWGIAVDESGNSFVTGWFEDSILFGAGEAEETMLTGQFLEMFVARYNPDGTLAWARMAGGSNLISGGAIAIEGTGSCFLTGWFEGDAIFGKGEANETSLLSNEMRDLFLARYEAQTATDTDQSIDLDRTSQLKQNYPNPFSSSTTIPLQVTTTSEVRLIVYDLLGRVVQTLVTGSLPPGYHEIVFRANELPGGIYFYQLETPEETLRRPMLLHK